MLGSRARGALGVSRDGHEREFGGLPRHGAVQGDGAAVGAVGGTDDFVALDVVAHADVADDARLDVAHQAGQVFALAELQRGAALAVAHFGAGDDADLRVQAVGAVRVEHRRPARGEAREIHGFGRDDKFLVVGLARPPVHAAHAGAGGPSHVDAARGRVER